MWETPKLEDVSEQGDGSALYPLHIASYVSDWMKGARPWLSRAPFVAWQLTNRCQAHCVTCCEESGPDGVAR